MTDSEIIEHLKNNKYSKAVNGLYNVLPSIKKYITANTGTGEDAKDIFQDALVVLYKKVHTGEFVLSVPLKSYLHAVAKNLWLQELRRRKKLPFDESVKDIADFKIDDEPVFGNAEAAFNLLGEKCRQLLMLFYFRKKSFREIAASLAFSDEKVAKNQKYRCIQKAKENFLNLSKNSTHE
jgi:RNA polymerase sigma factor (sigma-70 family)